MGAALGYGDGIQCHFAVHPPKLYLGLFFGDTGISTWVLDISPVIDSVQLGVWYIGGTAVGVLDIDIEIQ